jgi:hypothetical protein
MSVSFESGFDKNFFLNRGSFKMFNFEVSAYLFMIKEGDPPDAD